MSLLQDLLIAVQKNLKSKNKTPVEIYIILDKIRKKYKNDAFWNFSGDKKKVEVEDNTRENNLISLRDDYQDHGEKTDEWVFESAPNSINDQHEYGRTLLHTAILAKNKVEIKQLVKKGIDIKIKDNGGLTPFQIAIIEEDKIIISLLENLGINC